jgi:hypothetical protein
MIPSLFALEELPKGFVTTTEVYPDSPKASPEQCNAAQVAVICTGLDYALA